MNNENQLKQQLDRSCDLLNPQLQQRLKARTSLAKSRATQSHRHTILYALVPMALIVSLWLGIFNDPGLSTEEQALYDDLELLIAQDDLDFLDEMAVADWLSEEQSSDES